MSDDRVSQGDVQGNAIIERVFQLHFVEHMSLTATAMALSREFERTFTRNSVAGFIHRYRGSRFPRKPRLPAVDRPERPKRKRKPQLQPEKAEKVNHRTAAEEFPPDGWRDTAVEAPSKWACTICDLSNTSCRWPLSGKYPLGEQLYCGRPGANFNIEIPYCKKHHDRSWRPRERRVRHWLWRR